MLPVTVSKLKKCENILKINLITYCKHQKLKMILGLTLGHTIVI